MSSNMHKMGGLDFDDLQGDRKYRRWFAYGHSKLANLLFAFELQRRATAAGSNLLSLAAHPGYAATELHSKGAQIGGATVQEKIMGLGVKLGAQSSADGAWPMLYAATAPGVPGGAFVGPSKRMETIGPPKLTRGQRALTRRGRRAPPLGGLRAAHRRALRVRSARSELIWRV